MTDETIGQMLKRLRKERGLTQGQLAEFAGVSRSWVSLVEKGIRKKPEPDYLRHVARVLRVPVDTLLSVAGYEVNPLPIRDERSTLEIMRELEARIKQQEQERQSQIDLLTKTLERYGTILQRTSRRVLDLKGAYFSGPFARLIQA